MFGIGQFIIACIIAFSLYMKDEYEKEKINANREFKRKYYSLVESYYRAEAETWKESVVDPEVEAIITDKLKEKAVFLSFKKYIINQMGDRGRLLMERVDSRDLVKRFALAMNGCISEDELVNHITVNPHNEVMAEYREAVIFFNAWCSKLVENRKGIRIEFVPSQKYIDNEGSSVYISSTNVEDLVGVKNPKCGVFYWTKDKLDHIMEKAFKDAC